MKNLFEPVWMRPILAFAFALGFCALLPRAGDASSWSLFPPILAISVGILTRRLILGLSLAVISGGVLASDAVAGVAIHKIAITYLYEPVFNSFSGHILAFTACLIGMVRVTSLAGGNRGIALLLSQGAAGARSCRFASFLMGLAIFFDDYTNTIVVGSTMRPITDRFRVSREKLAYLVDSTAAPIAGLAIISTWIGYEVGLFEDLMKDLGTGYSGYQLFFAALPSRFYCILTLVFVVSSTLLGRDFGPMLRAERRAQQTGQVLAEGARPMTRQYADVETIESINPRWWVAAIPVMAVIAAVIFGIGWDTRANAEVVSAASEGYLTSAYWTDAFKNADSAGVLFRASILGALLAFVLALTRCADGSPDRPISLPLAISTFFRGVWGVWYAFAILILAWAIKAVCDDVGTGDYLTHLLSPVISPFLLPLLIFLLASVVAFSIGTSWTTMAILIPTVVPLAHNLGDMALTILAAAAVLDGAIFGDHCSPISDTTVMSSIASSCDHLDHVKTQVPYALTTMGVAAVCGYLGTAAAYPSIVGLGIGVVVILTILLVIGKPTDALPS
ncbi:TPA: sodium:proton antiporter [Candidatus Latescibacteria bacterium]|nr:sodium:proton antiporter [Candidatus Latescibacterota bacterium]